MLFIKEKFKDYHSLAMAELDNIYGKKNLEASLNFKATNFATTYFENTGNGSFTSQELGNMAQLALTRTILVEDVDHDGSMDAIFMENKYGFEIETPRQDAGYGLYLKGNRQGTFEHRMPHESGLYVHGEVLNGKT